MLIQVDVVKKLRHTERKVYFCVMTRKTTKIY